jgi:hypothetical protein
MARMVCPSGGKKKKKKKKTLQVFVVAYRNHNLEESGHAFAEQDALDAAGTKNRYNLMNAIEAEMDLLWKYKPEVWWHDHVSHFPRRLSVGCPSCGDAAVSVGSTFKTPRKKFEKGWCHVNAWIEADEDMVAKSSCCATMEQHEKLMKNALNVRSERVSLSRRRQNERQCREGVS